MTYDKQADRRDRQAASWIERDFDCTNYTNQHLRNALRFAQGCSGSEAVARSNKLRIEIDRRAASKSPTKTP